MDDLERDLRRWADARDESRRVFSNVRIEYYACLNALAKANAEFKKKLECEVLQSEVLRLQQDFSRLDAELNQLRKTINDVDIEYSKVVFEIHAARDLLRASNQNPPGAIQCVVLACLRLPLRDFFFQYPNAVVAYLESSVVSKLVIKMFVLS
jgi:hypothetical protein